MTADKPIPDIFIIGCGDIGSLIAGAWQARGNSVSALARSAATAERLQALGIATVSGDLDQPESLATLPVGGSLLYYLAPPPPRGIEDSRMRHFLASLESTSAPRGIVYISTSGVYGDRNGAWVNEETPPHPQADRARRRLDAENTLSTWCRQHGVPLTILRVAGIYGPERLPLERLRAGTPVLRPEECGYTNRIHVADLVAICLAAGERGEGIHLFNVSDGHPGTMTDYFFAVADALGLPRPAVITMAEAEQQLTPAMLSYLRESRRIDNKKLLRELPVTLRYPDLASGLAAIADRRVILHHSGS